MLRKPSKVFLFGGRGQSIGGFSSRETSGLHVITGWLPSGMPGRGRYWHRLCSVQPQMRQTPGWFTFSFTFT